MMIITLLLFSFDFATILICITPHTTVARHATRYAMPLLTLRLQWLYYATIIISLMLPFRLRYADTLRYYCRRWFSLCCCRCLRYAFSIDFSQYFRYAAADYADYFVITPPLFSCHFHSPCWYFRRWLPIGACSVRAAQRVLHSPKPRPPDAAFAIYYHISDYTFLPFSLWYIYMLLHNTLSIRHINVTVDIDATLMPHSRVTVMPYRVTLIFMMLPLAPCCYAAFFFMICCRHYAFFAFFRFFHAFHFLSPCFRFATPQILLAADILRRRHTAPPLAPCRCRYWWCCQIMLLCHY